MKSQENKQQLDLDLKWVVSTLRKGSTGFLYALLAALIQAEDKIKLPETTHLSFEREYCISKIKAKLESSDNPVRLIERAWSFLKMQPTTD